MKAIGKWRDTCALLFAASVLLTALFVSLRMTEATITYGAAGTVALACLIRQNRLLHDASLICDNPILSVQSAMITRINCPDAKVEEETVVSTFGLLLGCKVYKWGCDGVSGTRLSEIRLDRGRIWLTFGTRGEALCVQLLHGMTDKQNVIEIAQKLWHETGIQADISDWSLV